MPTRDVQTSSQRSVDWDQRLFCSQMLKCKLSVKLHLRDGRTDGRRDATMEFDIVSRQITGRGGLVVTRLPAAREDPGSRRAAGKSLCFHENHCDTQLWARAAH